MTRVAGYSATPLPQKLGLKDAGRLRLINAPPEFEDLLTPLPEDAIITRRAGKGLCDVILLFCKDIAALERGFAPARDRIEQHGGLWVCWPKKASGVKTDLTEDVVRDVGLAAGLVDNKVCAIDAVWSGLRLVIRTKDRVKPH